MDLLDASGPDPVQPPSSAEALRKRTALCLSGGGFRAALFHLGALRRLHEVGALAKIDTVSCVSGGSIAGALLAHMWPTIGAGIAHGRPGALDPYEQRLRAFCARDLRTGPLVWQRLNPLNWPRLVASDASATTFLAEAYTAQLVPGGTLGDLARAGSCQPRFVLCASNLDTGASFELTAERVGDYQLGYRQWRDLPLGVAVAGSSAFPMAFPPLVLDDARVKFTGGACRGDLRDALRERVQITDGGVYDNLGLEPVWKSHGTVLCSDGGKPFDIRPAVGSNLVSRLMRAQEVVGAQALAVRRRWLISAFERNDYEGSYWGIGSSVAHYRAHATGYTDPTLLLRIRAVRTDLDAFSEAEQLVLMNHGWSMTDAALRTHGPAFIARPFPPGTPPSAGLLEDQAAARVALVHSAERRWIGRSGDG